MSPVAAAPRSAGTAAAVDLPAPPFGDEKAMTGMGMAVGFVIAYGILAANC